MFIILQLGGPPKKGKPAFAPSAKGKKCPETKEFVETELSVSRLFKRTAMCSVLTIGILMLYGSDLNERNSFFVQ